MQIVRILLLPISWIYGLILFTRNLFYNWGFPGTYEVPVKSIVVGNLQLGGTGKTPHLAYLLEILKDKNCVVVSRGYGGTNRETLLVDASMTAAKVGDEPLEIARKFPNVSIVVDADRKRAIQYIGAHLPKAELILFDDALQHRKIKAGLNLLLTTWDKPYTRDHYLPAGSLRDHKIRSKDCNLHIVTKCPRQTTTEMRRRYQDKNDLPSPLVFTQLKYGEVSPLLPHQQGFAGQPIILLSAIAKPIYFEDAAKERFHVLKHFSYRDHHYFTDSELGSIDSYRLTADVNAVILTTEKDASRLMDMPWVKNHLSFLVYVWPISVEECDLSQPLKAAVLNYVKS